jgi:hypothetical protein
MDLTPTYSSAPALGGSGMNPITRTLKHVRLLSSSPLLS